MPLVSTMVLSSKRGSEAYLEAVVDRSARTVRFAVREGPGAAPPAPKEGRGATFRCLVCEHVATDDYLRAEGAAGRMGVQLLAKVVDGSHGRRYLPVSDLDEAGPAVPQPGWLPDGTLSLNARHSTPPTYGMRRFADLFTPRQLVVLTTLADQVGEVREDVLQDALAAGMDPSGGALSAGGLGAEAYADAVATYLSLAVSRLADFNNTIASWDSGNTNLRQLFVRQAMPMSWDFAEANLLAGPVSLSTVLGWITTTLAALVPVAPVTVELTDATTGSPHQHVAVATDPPYYDNVPYADLADFYYVWLRHPLKHIWPDLFETTLTPKASELVADPVRQGGRWAASEFFDTGMRRAFRAVRKSAAGVDAPVTIFYAFKQAESADSGSENVTSNTGWSTMLEGLLAAGYVIVGTWPLRTEQAQRSRASRSNALASSIVLVCRVRDGVVSMATRRDFVASLKREMPTALRDLQHGNIAPVDLAQSAIGPGMAIFSRYERVLEPDGTAMSVRTALALINQALDEILAEQEGEFDSDTRWAIAWYEQYGMGEAEFGVADVLARAKNTSVQGMVDAGIVAASRGRVRLLARDQYDQGWDPAHDRRLPAWEAAQRLVHVLLTQGEGPAGELLARLGSLGETARDLAYRLYQVSERKGWTDEARAYNALVVAWSDLSRGASSAPASAGPAQQSLGLE